ncbi:MAG: FAD-dependent oxidoreductase [Burkholderiales bacterium]
MKRLVLVGGGHTHIEILRRWAIAPVPATELVLVSPARDAPYSGMLPGLMAGHYRFRDAHIDLEALAHAAGARFITTLAHGLEPAQRRLRLADGAALPYDLVSLDAGSIPAGLETPGAATHAIALRPVAALLSAWEDLRARAQAGGLRRVVVVGGGAGGVELLLAMQYRLAALGVRFVAVFDTAEPLASHPARVRARFTRVLAGRGVETYAGRRVAAVEAGAVVTESGQRIAADAIIWATGPAPAATWHNSGLALDDDGFLLVDAQLRSVSDTAVFATGDCATLRGQRYPRSGVYAVRQGPVLAGNLRAALTGGALADYVPQARALALISTGDRYAVASWGPLSFAGRWVWRWKDRIDRRFMSRYRCL